MINIEWIATNGTKCFAYYLDIVEENSKSIYASGIYGDIYRVEKKSKKLYINGKYQTIATLLEII